MTSSDLTKLLRDIHWNRIQLIGCMDKDERMALRLVEVELQRQLQSGEVREEQVIHEEVVA
jgi:hypothetical protein